MQCERCLKSEAVVLLQESWLGTGGGPVITQHWYCLQCCGDVEAGQHLVTRRLLVHPQVGMPATVSVGSDRYPYTVVAVNPNGKEITVQRDEFTADKEANHNYFGQQRWVIVRNPDGPTEIWTLRNDGRWRRKGDRSKHGGGIGLGHARPYIDPHF